MKRWALMATWATTGGIRARELPLAGGFRFTDMMRGAGTLDATLKTTVLGSDGRPRPRPLSPNLEQDYWATVLWPMFYGQPVGAYFLTGHTWDSDAPSVEGIHGDHASAILDRRIIRDTLSFTQVDQNQIARDLLRYAVGVVTQSTGPGFMSGFATHARLPWITWSDANSGVLRDRLETAGNTDDGYPADARKVVGQMLRNLSDLGAAGGAELPGPDIRWMYELDPATGLPLMRMDLGYPTVGVPASSARLVMEWPGGNVTKLKEAGAGGGMVNLAEVLGADNNGARPIGTRADMASMSSGVPLLAKTWSESSVSGQTVLDQKAAGQVAGLSRPSLGWSVSLDGARPPRFTTYWIGDAVRLKLRRGTQLLDRTVRITGWDIAVDDSGDAETITPTFQGA